MRAQFLIDAAKGFIVGKGAQQFVVAAAPFVGPGQNRIDDTQPAGCTEPLRSQPFTRWHKSIKIRCRMFQYSDNRRTDRNDPSVGRLSVLYHRRG